MHWERQTRYTTAEVASVKIKKGRNGKAFLWTDQCSSSTVDPFKVMAIALSLQFHASQIETAGTASYEFVLLANICDNSEEEPFPNVNRLWPFPESI